MCPNIPATPRVVFKGCFDSQDVYDGVVDEIYEREGTWAY